MKIKNIVLCAGGLAAALTLAACESSGTETAASNDARGDVHSTMESGSVTIPAVDTAVGTAELGQAAPNFTLLDVKGKTHTLSEYTADGKIVVLEWFNPDCPFVKKHYDNSDQQTMNTLAREFKGDDVVWLAINSGAAGLQGAGLERNRRAVDEWNIQYPVLLDMGGAVGKAYGATTTPHMFVIDADGVLVYNGAIDNNRGGRAGDIGDVNFVQAALTDVI